MSRKGQKRFAQVLLEVAKAKEDLLAMGWSPIYVVDYDKKIDTGTENSQEDIRLASMLDEMKSIVVYEFEEITRKGN